MHYYIDGYNLMFRIMRAGDDLTAQREQVIQDLARKLSVLQLNATLVFDAQYQRGESTRSHFEDLEILFTEHGQTADDLIVEAIKNTISPLKEIVVTSDKKLAARVRRRGAKTDSVEDFINLLNRRYRNKLKQTDQKKVPSKVVIPKELPFISQPLIEAVPEQCFEYYLQEFEKEYIKLSKKVAASVSIAKASKRASQKPRRKSYSKPEKDPRSDMERWLQIFEERIKK